MKKQITLVFLFLITVKLFSQIGINTDNSTPNVSAQLDVKSTNKGLLLPRISTSATTFNSPAAGLMVYDQDKASLAYYNGSAWNSLANNGGSGGLYDRFPHSKSYVTYYQTAAIYTQDFDFIVPTGITKV